MGRSILAVVVAASFIGASPGPALDRDTLLGVWRIAYEPTAEGREGVYEPSAGYLVFMADGTYYEIREDCCEAPPRFMTRPERYSIEGRTVVLGGSKQQKRPDDRRLNYAGKRRVAFYENRKFSGVTAPVLRAGSDLNYSWARIFPAPATSAK